jgi:ribosome-binding factor A
MARGGRDRRMGQEIQRLLPDLIREEVKDPRVSGIVTVTDVEVSADLSQAKVFVTVMAAADAVSATLEGLNRSASFLRTQLSRSMRARTVPALRFEYDESVERGVRLARLIETAVEADSDRERSPEGLTKACRLDQ